MRFYLVFLHPFIKQKKSAMTISKLKETYLYKTLKQVNLNRFVTQIKHFKQTNSQGFTFQQNK